MQPVHPERSPHGRRRGARARRAAAVVALAAAAALTLALAAACSGAGGATATPAGAVDGTTHAVTTPAAAASGTPVPMSTAAAPWPAPANAVSHITAAGLPALGGEQLAYHVHAHLDLVIEGNPQVVPAGIGIDLQRQLISPLHTHDTSGIIHIEAAHPATFTLGQLFIEWGVRLDAKCVGGYCDGPDQQVRAYVNGKPFPGDPRTIALTSHEEVAIVVGAQRDIPSSFEFPAGD